MTIITCPFVPGTGHKNIDGDVQSHDEPPRMDWLLRLGCHRDSSVRSLAFAILADLTPAGPQLSTGVSHVSGYAAFAGDDGVHGRDEAFAKVEEVGWSILGKGGTSSCSVGDISDGRSRAGGFVQSCVRAALDGTHESPAVMTEALRFLGRYADRCVSVHRVASRLRNEISHEISHDISPFLFCGDGCTHIMSHISTPQFAGNLRRNVRECEADKLPAGRR